MKLQLLFEPRISALLGRGVCQLLTTLIPQLPCQLNSAVGIAHPT
ncbi:MAG TPA: hypothetical protein VK184_08120 [Nostocaceae cyanobacterium]|nr:hypothetical protein [Nostocaceae cyanobacterium]